MNEAAERWLALSSEARDTWYRAAMPLRVSPARTTCTVAAAPGDPEGGLTALVRGTVSTAPAWIWWRLRTSLRAASTATVVRKRAAMPSRVSPGLTR